MFGEDVSEIKYFIQCYTKMSMYCFSFLTNSSHYTTIRTLHTSQQCIVLTHPAFGRHFVAAIFKCTFMNKKFCVLNLISLKFDP